MKWFSPFKTPDLGCFIFHAQSCTSSSMIRKKTWENSPAKTAQPRVKTHHVLAVSLVHHLWIDLEALLTYRYPPV